MEFLKTFGRALGDAVSYVGEKNRKAAYLNRIRTVIKCEEQAAEKEYLALGRYYYNNLRDPSNAVTEPHCAELEAIEARLDAALQQLEKFYSGEEIPASDGNREEVDLSDVQVIPAPTEETAAGALMEEEISLEGDISPKQEGTEPASPDENDNLPFEG